MNRFKFQTSLSRLMHALHATGLFIASLVQAAGEPPALTYKTHDQFKIPKPGYQFQFPRDHGSHPEFKIEWWYFTGHLYAENKKRFAFQATFFRTSSRDSKKKIRQFHIAHMAVADVAAEQHLHQERINRSGWDAQSDTKKMNLHNGNWSLKMIGGPTHPETMQLRGSVKAEADFDLRLTPLKEKVIFGKNSVSRKAKAYAAASYYVTFPRLQAEGTLTWQGRKMAVSGQAWMDHEISSSQLDNKQRGWDWASIQFNDGREMMVYVLREENDQASPFSTLAWIKADGNLSQTYSPDFSWTKKAYWESPKTGAKYPVHHILNCVDPENGKPMRIELIPFFNAQEMEGKIGGIDYWEGACDVRDASGKSLGSAFVELTGYNEAIGKHLSTEAP